MKPWQTAADKEKFRKEMIDGYGKTMTSDLYSNMGEIELAIRRTNIEVVKKFDTLLDSVKTQSIEYDNRYRAMDNFICEEIAKRFDPDEEIPDWALGMLSVIKSSTIKNEDELCNLVIKVMELVEAEKIKK